MTTRGLSDSEAARRLAAQPPYEPTTSRTYASIVRANVLTVFNLILLLAGAATLTFGAWQDALFLGVLVSNSAIGIAQEVRAKRALDSLATLVAPTATVVRDGESRRIPATEVVEGDLVLLAAGDGVVADGELQARQRALARRVDPHRRIAPDDSQAGRDGPLGLVRRRRSRRAAGRRRRGRQLCRPRDGRGARIPPPAIAARACAEQAPAHARRRDRPARPRPRLGPLGA